MSDILPCPFCGKAAALNSARAGFEDLVYFVRCPNCGARGPVLEDNVEAITLWNKPARDEEVRQ